MIFRFIYQNLNVWLPKLFSPLVKYSPFNQNFTPSSTIFCLPLRYILISYLYHHSLYRLDYPLSLSLLILSFTALSVKNTYAISFLLLLTAPAFLTAAHLCSSHRFALLSAFTFSSLHSALSLFQLSFSLLLLILESGIDLCFL